MTNWVKDKSQIEVRADGTFVVQAEMAGEYLPYHVTPEYCPELWASVKAQVEAAEA